MAHRIRRFRGSLRPQPAPRPPRVWTKNFGIWISRGGQSRGGNRSHGYSRMTCCCVSREAYSVTHHRIENLELWSVPQPAGQRVADLEASYAWQNHEGNSARSHMSALRPPCPCRRAVASRGRVMTMSGDCAARFHSPVRTLSATLCPVTLSRGNRSSGTSRRFPKPPVWNQTFTGSVSSER